MRLLSKGGTTLFAKGGMSAGSSLLGSVVSGLISSGGGGRGGSGGMGGGRGASGGMGGGRGASDSTGGKGGDLSSVLEQALMRAMKNSGTTHGRKSAGKKEAGEVTEVPSQTLSQKNEEQEGGVAENVEQNFEQKKLALAALTEVLTSYIPGRARFRHQAFKDASGAEVLKEELLQLGFRGVEWKSSTGSILLTWDEDKWDQVAFFASALPLGEYLLDREGV